MKNEIEEDNLIKKRKIEFQDIMANIPKSVINKLYYNKSENSLILYNNNFQENLKLNDVEYTLNIMGNKSIKKLTIDGIFTEENDNNYEELLTIINNKYQDLEELTMSNFLNPLFTKSLSILKSKIYLNLKKITFSHCNLNEIDSLCSFLNRSRMNIQHLDLSDCWNMNRCSHHTFFPIIDIVYPRLETLILNRIKWNIHTMANDIDTIKLIQEKAKKVFNRMWFLFPQLQNLEIIDAKLLNTTNSHIILSNSLSENNRRLKTLAFSPHFNKNSNKEREIELLSSYINSFYASTLPFHVFLPCY